MLDMKEDGRIALAFEHFFLHFLISSRVSGATGGGINEQLSLGKRRIGIDGERAALELEGPAHIPGQTAHLEADLCRCRIKMYFDIARGNRGRWLCVRRSLLCV